MKMKIRVAINGFGRIGRLLFRQLFESDLFEITAINDPAPVEISAYLLKYDTSQGTYRYANQISYSENAIHVCGKRIVYSQCMEPEELPWKQLGVQWVAECSGAYRSLQAAEKHLEAGAEKVIISSPAGNNIPTVVYGVNHSILKGDETVLSAASCSTNALAPMVEHLHDFTPISSGMMLVIHGYTSTQMLQDNAQKKGNLRRSRAAAENIIPTTAEAAAAVGRVIPELNGKLSGSAVRVPVPAGCLITFTAVVQSSINLTPERINDKMKLHSSEFFGYAEDEYVSSDIVGNTFACIFDPTQTLVTPISDGEYEIRVAAWFDNENSFVSQMFRLMKYCCSLKNSTLDCL